MSAIMIGNFIGANKIGVGQPAYSSLSNVAAIYDSTGLVAGENNNYGQVGADNTIGAAGLKSLAPGPTGRDMLPVGTGLTLTTVNGIKVINGNGSARLQNTGGSANFNFLHYNATFANLKWTIHLLIKVTSSDAAHGIIGNNAGGSANKGASVFYDNRSGLTRTNGISTQITRGVGSSPISNSYDNEIISYGTWQVITIEFDGSLATAAERMTVMVDGVNKPITVTSSSEVVATTPTYDLELFAIGNNTFPAAGQISHCVIQSGIESDSVRDTFIDSLIAIKTVLNG